MGTPNVAVPSSETPHCHYPVLGTPQCCHPLLGTPVPLPLRGIPQCHHPCLGWRWNSITSSQMTLWWIRCFCNYLQDNTQKGRCCCCSSWWNFLYKGTSRQASGEISCINIDESSGRSASEAAQPNQDVPHGCRSLPSTSRDPMMCPEGCSSLQPCQCTWRNALHKTRGFSILTPLHFMSWAEAFLFILISFLNLSLVSSRFFTTVLLSASEHFGEDAQSWCGQDRFNSSCCPLYSVIIAGIFWSWRVWGFVFFFCPEMFLFREDPIIT